MLTILIFILEDIALTLLGKVFLLVLLLLPSICFAAPNITLVSGMASSGESVVISGSSFGTHADNGGSEDFLNAAWHDIEDGNLSGGNLGLIGGAGANWSASGTENRTNSNYNARKLGPTCAGATGTAYGFSHSSGESYYYASTWMWVDTDSLDGKFSRIWDGDCSGNTHNIYLSTGSGVNNEIRGGAEYVPPTCSPTPKQDWGEGEDSFQDETWHRVEYLLVPSTNTITTWLDGVQQWTHNDWVGSPFGSTAPGWEFGGYNLGCEWRFDDVYFDYTPARVEVCSGSTWAAKGVCEIQIPTAWSTSEITVTFNQGDDSDDDDRYLYVVDSSNTANSEGFPLTVGEMAGPQLLLK